MNELLDMVDDRNLDVIPDNRLLCLYVSEMLTWCHSLAQRAKD